MIKINLLGEEPKSDVSTPLNLGVFFISIVAVAAMFLLLGSQASQKIADRDNEKLRLDGIYNSLRKKTTEVRKLDERRDELKAKIAVIAKLKKSKAGPVRVMDDLNTSVPNQAWVSTVEERSGLFEIVGLALDNQTIAKFMKDLEESEYFLTVDLVEARIAEYDDVKMKQFTLSAKISYAGSLEIADDSEEEEA